jgi:mRNA interferase RelE/StbE
MREILYAKSALKSLLGMPRNEAERIRAKVEQYAASPRSLGNNVKALAGSPFIRLRVGDWRVIMDDRDAVLEIVRIGPRGGVYE